MKKLLSLPPNLVGDFYKLTNYDAEEWFCSSDPIDCKLGSGGGTTWLLKKCFEKESQNQNFEEWLASERRILLHAGGQGRRIPAYAPSGKILTPIPIYRWARGQRLSQNLLELQLPLYNDIMERAPKSLTTLIASGDVLIRTDERLADVPEADVVCYGLWASPELAQNHGVFVSSRKDPGKLDYMLQKPSVDKMNELMQTHTFMMDIGVWLLSDRAINVLCKRSMNGDEVTNYDLYSEFGCTLGTNPTQFDEEVSQLSVAVVPLKGGQFYHYGTSRELLSSTVAVQNLVCDQTAIMHHNIKPQPSIFTQNSDCRYKFSAQNNNIWIENSYVAEEWSLTSENIITGVPKCNISLSLPKGVCVDVVPVDDEYLVARVYGFHDKFRGNLYDESTEYLGIPFKMWAAQHNVDIHSINGTEDLQSARIFPLMRDVNSLMKVVSWMTGNCEDKEALALWNSVEHLSADDISTRANLMRLEAQRKDFRRKNWHQISRNHSKSVFYQLDLADAAKEFVEGDIDVPNELENDVTLINNIHRNMFASEVNRLRGKCFENEQSEAFRLLQEGLTSGVTKQCPHSNVYSDQIVWGRSPVRIDVAGGWTDTPPFCLMEGGNVINFAIELNGQPPIQTFVKPCSEFKIVMRSIDLGAVEEVSTFEELRQFNKVGSPFSIPKAALALCGFLPEFSVEPQVTLHQQLMAFGSGVEITLLSAIPAGSGLGTSSILASTVLGALSDFCGLHWDKNTIGHNTLVLEQLLTTGGGWQDQFGGLLPGIKFLQTTPGFLQTPIVRWLPDTIFTNPESSKCHLLYYTGITRTAKDILAEIVRGMFLNSSSHLDILRRMKNHTLDLYDVIQRSDFNSYGNLVRKTWLQNCSLDSGTNPVAVRKIEELIDDLCLGYKLPGAGGGGYMYMVAKDPDAAIRIRHILQQNPPNDKARFVEMSISKDGLQLSRS